jgi:hypothetical protein
MLAWNATTAAAVYAIHDDADDATDRNGLPSICCIIFICINLIVLL